MSLRGSLRSSSAWAMASGTLLALAVLGAALGGLFIERKRAVAGQLERGEVYARVLEDHVTRSVESSASALASLAARVGGVRQADTGSLSGGLTQMVGDLTYLRSVSVMDAGGRVLASSQPGEVGLNVKIASLGAMPESGRDIVGGLVKGRDLADLSVGSPARPVPEGMAFMPVLRAATSRGGEPVLLAALINPDALATHMRLTLNDPSSSAVLASYNGVPLVSTERTLPTRPLADMPVFRRYLPTIEHASYIGDGMESGTQVLAFRVSRNRPLVVLVERSQEAVLAAWAEDARWVGGFGGAAALFIFGMGFTASRSLRGRELARVRLDRAQAEVTRREQELSTIVRSVQELLFRTNATGQLTFVNARWAAACGQPVKDVLNRPLPDLVRQAERSAVWALFAHEGSQGVRNGVMTLGADSGPGRRFEVAVVPLTKDGQIVGFAGSAVDVTQRLEAQSRLQEQLTFTAMLLEISPLPTSMFDARGHYLSVNRAWEEFTGHSRTEVIGLTPSVYLPREDVARHRAKDLELIASGGSLRYEATMKHADGSQRDLMVNKVLVPGREGQPAGILCSFMDVSEMRGAERATREARDIAEEASRSKSEFIANISHELRTPLQSIIGFSELGAVRGRAHEKLAAMFTDIHTSGRRMLALVNDLLDVSKLESAVGTFHLERTDLRPLVRDVVRELAPLLDDKALRVDMRLSGAALVAKVDPLRFQQVVRNVVANAIKFSPQQSPIEVLGEATADGKIHIAVRDNGPGIPPAELQTIFEAFVQSSKTKDGSGGTGLGLAICRRIVDAHGGHMHAENADGGGSCFHVYLPARGFADTGTAVDLPI